AVPPRATLDVMPDRPLATEVGPVAGIVQQHVPEPQPDGDTAGVIPRADLPALHLRLRGIGVDVAMTTRGATAADVQRVRGCPPLVAVAVALALAVLVVRGPPLTDTG